MGLASQSYRLTKPSGLYGLLQEFQLLDKLSRRVQIPDSLGVEMMMTFKEGDLVGVPCSIQLGPFPDERLITVETEDGLLSGFVKNTNLETTDGEHGLVKGLVVEVSGDSVTVKLFGSFFTTALGVASVRPNGLTRLAA